MVTVRRILLCEVYVSRIILLVHARYMIADAVLAICYLGLMSSEYSQCSLC